MLRRWRFAGRRSYNNGRIPFANDTIRNYRLEVRETAAKSDVVAELCMKKVLSEKHDNRAVGLYKTVNEAIL